MSQCEHDVTFSEQCVPCEMAYLRAELAAEREKTAIGVKALACAAIKSYDEDYVRYSANQALAAIAAVKT